MEHQLAAMVRAVKVLWAESPHRRTLIALWGVALLVSAVLGIGGAAVGWVAMELRPQVDLGQAEGVWTKRLHEGCFRLLGPTVRPDLSPRLTRCLEEMVEANHEEGLRYVAIARNPIGRPFTSLRGSVIFAEAGVRRSDPLIDGDWDRHGVPFPVEDRHVYMLPPHPPLKDFAAPITVVEYLPTRMRALERLAAVAVVSGLLGVGVTFAGALLIGRLLQQREQAQRQLRQQEQLAALGRMSAVMAHELRTPLASAKGRTQLLVQLMGASSPLYARAQRVVDELIRIETVTTQLLDFIRSGKVKTEWVEPAELVREAAARVLPPERLLIDDDRAPPRWGVDPYAFERVIINLLKNAQQAQGDLPAPIELTVSVRAGALYVRVRDRGPGFPPGVDGSAPFVTTRSGGTGLGLTVVRQVVEAHGGVLRLGRAPGGGALVEMWLPEVVAERGAQRDPRER